MLVLSRKVGERIRVGDHVTITVVRIQGGAVRVGVEAPHDMLVVRGELASRLEVAKGIGDDDQRPTTDHDHGQA